MNLKQKIEIEPVIAIEQTDDLPLYVEDIPRIIANNEWATEASRRNDERPLHEKALHLGRITTEDVMLEEAARMNAQHDQAHQEDNNVREHTTTL